jgi:HTH-type transcriptional regulator, competence development regulator
MPFGDQLRAYRLRAGLTLRQLGEKAALDFGYVSKIETGKVPPPPREAIEQLGKSLKLSADELAEFLALAGTIPRDMEQWAVRAPARQLYRSLRELPEAEQEELLHRLISEVKRDRDPNGGER